MRLFLEVLHHCVEGGTSVAGGNGDGVHVNLDGQYSSLEAMTHLVTHVEDEGGVDTVVEQQFQVHVVAVLVLHLLVALDEVTGVFADAEGEQASASYVHVLAVHVAVTLPAGAVVNGDGVVAATQRVEHR